MYVLPSFSNPQLNKFEKYNRLYNWDLPQYSIGDFDNDGKKDAISYAGCAFLSSINTQDIPQNRQCTSNIAAVDYPYQKDRVGQKYGDMNTTDLDLTKALPIYHSYLFKKHNENWKIFVKSKQLVIFEIQKGRLLQKMENVPIEFKIDEILYSMSRLFTLLILPFYYLFFFIQAQFLSVILPLITTITYFIWKKIYPFSMIGSVLRSDSNMNNKSKTIKNNSLPGPISILKKAWKVYGENLKKFIAISLLTSLGNYISNILSFLGVISFESSPMLYVLIYIVAMAISSWGGVSLLYAIRDENKGTGIGEAFAKGLKKLKSYVWLLLLSIFIMLGGFFLFLIPWILSLVWFSMGIYILVTENIGGMNALLKSREYVRGYFWAVAGRNLFCLIFSSLPIVMFNLLHLPSYINAIFSTIFSIVSMPLFLIYGFLLYENLKSIKGDFVFKPSLKKKILFVIIGIWGIVFTLILLVFAAKLLNFNTQRPVNFKGWIGSSIDVGTIRIVLEKYYSDLGLYPSSLDDLVPRYLSNVPLDPKTKKPYGYQVGIDKKDYKLCFFASSATIPFQCIGNLNIKIN